MNTCTIYFWKEKASLKIRKKMNELKSWDFLKLSFMAKALSNGKSQNDHLLVNEDVFTSLTSNLITYFVEGLILGKKS